MTPPRDLYQVLGVAPGAGRDEIRRAQRRLAHALHPDRHATAPAAERQLAERRMREINEAWRVLSDPERRRRYDAERRASASSPASAAANSAGSSARTSTHGPPGAAGPSGPRPHARPVPDDEFDDTDPFDRRDAFDDPDDLDVHPGTFLLLRRGPMVAIITVAVLLFVVTAYAGGSGGDKGVQAAATEMCVLLTEGSRGQLIDCSLPNDGKVQAEVKAPLDCPDRTRYAFVGSEIFCIPLDAP